MEERRRSGNSRRQRAMTGCFERWGVIGLFLASLVEPSHAICTKPHLISSAFPPGSYSYIQTPGIEPATTGSSVTAKFEGFFWAVGGGHPTHGQGRDNGTFVAQDSPDCFGNGHCERVCPGGV